MSEVVMYVFAGRRENLALQLPLYERVLEDHPEIRLDVWNLTKLMRDAEFVRRMGGPGRRLHPRLRVRNDYHSIRPWWRRFDYVWKHYTRPEYQDTHFIKLDDDVVFWQTDRLGEFIEASKKAPGTISSALTINNGASLKQTPGMQKEFAKLKIPLLDVHKHGEFAQFSHDFALDHWDELLAMPIGTMPVEDWVSINMISYDYATGRQVANPLGKHLALATHIAGRDFESGAIMGDEGSCNLLPRQIVRGFLAAHLTFGPQELPKDVWTGYRKRYEEAGRLYLER